ncbi:NAD(P)-dependent dehydrogenase (short-subunit alcohol dehydrogenase family) [Mycolicibacterium sp. BK556]|uniref:SDR family NAD(P)-dependent oxidoreductase n=1 Tax=unclassified Mycolicibacterium TaxID=2636767 RepID=UPI00161664AD|nr:NAD(P)-dependent dehydrogenase (short-subunit alcohol dehydrogenase family) [Mycolicibacterium sp. BK556]MBB3631498.1 NAD(P)-dependent dehydrogenase (short-subunit alcohol dehydrogenase family) [Mycolicibacterium sp. BK607]
MSDRPLDGFGAVVVGGSRGIGAAVSALLGACGAGVVVNGRDGAAAQETVDAIVAAGGRAVPHAGSGADEAVADDLITLCEKEFGAIDALVNCAGAPEPPGSSILSVTPAEFRDLLDVHVGTTFATCRAAAPKMVARGRGAIVNTSSFAFLGDYGGTGYPAGKGAVNGLTMAIAAELAEHGVRANVVCPGAKTRLSTGPDYEEQIASLRRRGLLDEVSAQGALDAPAPDYVAPMYAYLVSDLAKKITGQIFIAAGGFVGRFDRPSPSLIGYRDHNDSPPWTIDEIAEMLT